MQLKAVPSCPVLFHKPGKLNSSMCWKGDLLPQTMAYEPHYGNAREFAVFDQNEIVAVSAVSNKFEHPNVNADSYKHT